MQITPTQMHSPNMRSSLTRLRFLASWQPTSHQLTVYFACLNALYLLWMAGLTVRAGACADTLRWWHASPLWQALAGYLPDYLVIGAGILVEIVAALCLLGYRRRRALMTGSALACLVYGFNLRYMLSNPVWVAKLGGFPFLGSGQGVIKYVPMLATSVFLLGKSLGRPTIVRTAVGLGWLGVVMVMGWIGSMKFFLFEAQGIEPLLRHHWVFGWMYSVYSVQGVSNAIGMIELAFALLVALSWHKRALAPLALAGIGITVACTASFMFTLPGWNADSAFPWLNGTGIFLLKDAFLFASAVLLLGVRDPHNR